MARVEYVMIGSQGENFDPIWSPVSTVFLTKAMDGVEVQFCAYNTGHGTRRYFWVRTDTAPERTQDGRGWLSLDEAKADFAITQRAGS